ncbi:hypothetical protein DF196_10945 [Bifidobacterium callitrichidarum]|uniref:Zinc-ribbon domain-containing protein n=1 Tax=Bifidobacterium callitrichidarum TaxID=2052941 RepID=A0A2U2N2L6_9BIFI|nr:hypothetical protein DF196_10945 [Bifidobacterium callitrichidarum]
MNRPRQRARHSASRRRQHRDVRKSAESRCFVQSCGGTMGGEEFTRRREVLMFCPNCGAAVREGAQFCASCGTRVAQPAAQAAPAQPDAVSDATVLSTHAPAAPAAAQPAQPAPTPVAQPTGAFPAVPAPTVPAPNAQPTTAIPVPQVPTPAGHGSTAGPADRRIPRGSRSRSRPGTGPTARGPGRPDHADRPDSDPGRRARTTARRPGSSGRRPDRCGTGTRAGEARLRQPDGQGTHQRGQHAGHRRLRGHRRHRGDCAVRLPSHRAQFVR